MSSNMASRWREKAIIVTVYAETSTKRRFMTNNNQHNHQRRRHHHHLHHHLHHHHHHHLSVHQKPKQGGYNRRAELLDYSRHLRESAKSTPVLQLQPKPKSADSSQIVPVQNKIRPARFPTCFGSLTVRLPGFSGAKRERKKKSRNDQSTTAKMKSIVKSFQVRRKGGFFSRLFASLRRKR